MDIKKSLGSSLKELRAKQIIVFGNELLNYIDSLPLETFFQEVIKTNLSDTIAISYPDNLKDECYMFKFNEELQFYVESKIKEKYDLIFTPISAGKYINQFDLSF